MSIFRGLFEKKVADASALTWSVLDPGGRSKTGLSVNEATALRVSAVYGCCRVVTEDVGKLPLRVVQELPNGGKKVRTDHPLHRVLYRRPNEWQTSIEWRMTMLLHALLCRMGCSLINRDGSGRILELIPMLPHQVRPRQMSDWSIVYDFTGLDGRTITLPRESVHVLHGLSWNGFSALELVQQGQEAIGLAQAAEQTQALMHGNGAKPGGVLSTPAVLTQEQIDYTKEQFAQGYTGVGNAFRTLLLDNGLKFEPWAMTGVDGQHLETRKHQVEEICRLFRVFPQMIGASSATPTYASAESFFGAHVGHTLQPWIALWEQAILRDLFTEADVLLGFEAKFDMDELMRGSADQRSAYYESAISRAGWMSRNEARLKEGLNPRPGLDEILPPTGSTSGGTPKPNPMPAPPGGSQPSVKP